MALLKPFNPTILEINAVQTGGTAGASLAAGVVYTLPALIMLDYWDQVSYWETTITSIIGGTLGVLFSVPLRRVLIVEHELAFPEGVATAEVLKATMMTVNRRSKLLYIAAGSAIGTITKLAASAFLFWSETFEAAWYLSGAVLYIGCNVSPALVAVGYIVKVQTGLLLLIGGIINWLIAIPLMAYFEGVSPSTETALQAADRIWDTSTRFIGVGAMLAGGLGVVITLAVPAFMERSKECRSHIQNYSYSRV
jgi:putative OPT family oligopeptide transporter